MRKMLRRWLLRWLELEWVENLRPAAAAEDKSKPTEAEQLENLMNYSGMVEEGEDG